MSEMGELMSSIAGILKNVSRKGGTEKKKKSGIESWMFGLRVMCASLLSSFDRNVAPLFFYTNDFNAYKRKHIAICYNKLQVTR